MVGYLPAAVAFGVAARGAGLSAAEAVWMSLVVYSGAGQFALVGLLGAGASPIVAGTAALFLALRHVLYGPALAPHLRGIGRWASAPLAFGITDEVFVVASVELRGRRATFGWLAALEVGVYLAWVSGTWAGASAGAAITQALPSLAPALGFALPALFVALLVPLVLPEATPGKTPGVSKAPEVSTARTVDAGVAVAVCGAGVVAGAFFMVGLESWGLLAGGVIGPVLGVAVGGRTR